MWSDKQIFSKAQVYDTITPGDVEYTLASLLGKDSNKGSKLASVINKNSATEVVILFVEPELRTDQVPFISSAFASTPSGGSFSHIKNAIDSAKSSLVMPYTAVDEVTLLDEILLDTFETINTGNIFMSGSSLFARLRQYNGVKSVELDSLIAEMKAADAFDNGKTDLVIVSFDKATGAKNQAYSEHDEMIANILEGIRSSSKGDYVAIYTANTPTTSQLTWNFNEHAHAEFRQNIQMIMLDAPTVDANNSTVTNSTGGKVNYFPGPFIEVLLISSILITMLFTGACAIFSLQTPDKWEAPKIKSREL